MSGSWNRGYLVVRRDAGVTGIAVSTQTSGERVPPGGGPDVRAERLAARLESFVQRVLA